MVWHVGIVGDAVLAYNKKTEKRINFKLSLNFNSPFIWSDFLPKEFCIEKFDSTFNQIKTKLKGELGCLCIFLTWEHVSACRKNIIESALKCGFSKAQLLDYEAADYISNIRHASYKPQIDDMIWILCSDSCRIWKMSETGAILLKNVLFESKKETQNFLNIKEKYGQNKDPSIIFLGSNHASKDIKKTFPECKISITKATDKQSELEVALLKALIMAEDSDVTKLNAHAHLDVDVSVSLWAKNIEFFNRFEPLPIEKTKIANSLQYMRETEERMFTEFGEQMVRIPAKMTMTGKILITLKIDENRICTTNISLKPNQEYSESEGFQSETQNFYDQLPAILSTIPKHFLDSTDEDAPRNLNKISNLYLKDDEYILNIEWSNYFIKNPWYISFTEEKPFIGEIAKELFQTKPSFVVSNIIKICSIKNPNEADPKWPFIVKMDNDKKIVVEFDTKNGRKASSPAFLMALIFRDIKSGFTKATNQKLTEMGVVFDDIVKNETLISTLNVTADLVKIKITFP